MENWYLKQEYDNYLKIKNRNDFTNFQKIILANRNIVDDYKLNSILNPSLDNLDSPIVMKDMKKGVEILLEAMRMQHPILIVGDYDQDGVSATVILHKTISKIYDNVAYVIPDRIEDGYGINTSIIDQALADGVKLIITCDNGISAFEPIEYAVENGIEVIVTDHHQLVQENGKDVLPKAQAVINPHRQDDTSRFKIVCGAMVAFKFVKALASLYGASLGLDERYIDKLSQFAAMGTISDMMPIIDENRIIVVEGLKEVNKLENLGLRVLLEALNWDKEVSIYTIGFLIGPTINSSGRIYTANLGVELFLENDLQVARQYASTLLELNNERKNMTKDSVDLAISMIEDEKLHKNDIILLYAPQIHESICGLVAGRIKDKYNKPTIVMTDSSEPDLIKGSGRSIDAYNMHNNLSKLSNYFVSFGGHAKACGLTIHKKYLNELNRILNDESKLEKEDFAKNLDLDYQLGFNQISKDLRKQIDELGPYGYEYPEPIFASKNVKIIRASILGANKNVLKMTLENNGHQVEAISFDIDSLVDNFSLENSDQILDLIGKKVDVAYKITINTFRGVSTLQLNIVSMR